MPDEFKTTIRLSDDFNEQLRIVMARRRVKTLQDAVTQALELWIDGDGTERRSAPPSGSKELDSYSDFLQTADPAIVKIVKATIAAHQQLRERNSAQVPSEKRKRA